MALPIRDGNQSLTTLSTILVGNAHIPAHSVVSLGSQAITDIATAVSGVELGPNTISALENISVTFGVGTSITIGNVVSVTGGLTNAELRASSVTIGGSVSVSNLPVTQTVTFAQASVTFGQASVTFTTPTVTGSVSVLNFPATQTVTFTQASVTFGQAIVSASNINPLLQSVGTDNTADANLQFMKIGGHQDGSNQTSHIVHVSAGGAMKVDATDSSITFGAVTGSVSILNFPATQGISGTVTIGNTITVSSGLNPINASLKILGLDLSPSAPVPVRSYYAVTLGLGTEHIGSVTASISGTPSVTFTTATITGSTSILNFPATQTVTFTQASVTFGATTGSVSVSNFPSTQTIAGTVTVNSSANFDVRVTQGGDPVDSDNAFPIYGTVTVGNGLTFNDPSFGQNISAAFVIPEAEVGVVRSLSYFLNTSSGNIEGAFAVGNENPLPISGTVTVGNSVTISSLPSISGTVTIGGFSTVSVGSGGILVSGVRGGLPSPVSLDSGSGRIESKAVAQYSSGGGFVDVSTSNALPVSQQGAISGTVTVGAVPNGSLTTRFGTPTTANTAFATSAVTNANRKYLLVQNVTTGGNVITVGIGFTPTTTQGIQLAVGAGITFESSYIPTGAVYVLSGVTASNFTILEA
jgi:hypothetical protein